MISLHFTTHWQLVELCTDVTDSIWASTCLNTIHGYVQNGYCLVMKCSIRILCKMWGWPLSSQKAVWLLTTSYFGGCPLTFILTEDEDWSTEYIGVPPPWIKRRVANNRILLNWHCGSMMELWGYVVKWWIILWNNNSFENSFCCCIGLAMTDDFKG